MVKQNAQLHSYITPTGAVIPNESEESPGIDSQLITEVVISSRSRRILYD